MVIFRITHDAVSVHDERCPFISSHGLDSAVQQRVQLNTSGLGLVGRFLAKQPQREIPNVEKKKRNITRRALTFEGSEYWVCMEDTHQYPKMLPAPSVFRGD